MATNCRPSVERFEFILVFPFKDVLVVSSEVSTYGQ